MSKLLRFWLKVRVNKVKKIRIKEIDITKIIILVLIVIFAALAFGPCIQEIRHTVVPNFEGSHIVSKEEIGYAPIFCLAISTIELLLLIPKKSIFRLFGIFLCLAKSALPLYAVRIISAVMQNIGGYGYEHLLTPFGQAVQIFGFVIAAVYVIVFVIELKEKNKSQTYKENNYA